MPWWSQRRRKGLITEKNPLYLAVKLEQKTMPAALRDDEDPLATEGPWSMTLDDPVTPKQKITDPSVDTTTPASPKPTGEPPDYDPNSNVPPGGATPPAGGQNAADMIDALYTKYGIKDYGTGSGFADRAYWLAHPSEVLNGRLGRDLEGTGTDQPTGTPGAGPWLNSGRDAPEAAIGQPTRDAGGGFWDPAAHMVAKPTPGGSTDPGAGIPWTPGASQPSSAPPGYVWDPKQARFRLIGELTPKVPPPIATGGGAGGGTPVDPNDPMSNLP